MLKITDLKISIEDNTILENVNLELKPGSVVSISGPNGSGKSTLAQVLMRNKDFQTEGEILFKNQNLLQLNSYEASNYGIYTSFQNPPEIFGVNFANYLKEMINSKRIFENKTKLNSKEILDKIKSIFKILDWDISFLKRNLNEGLSGGEKKKSEIIQMLLLDPDLIILDEIDSGLDSAALQSIAMAIKNIHLPSKIVIIITHNPKFLEYIKPDQAYKIYNKILIKL